MAQMVKSNIDDVARLAGVSPKTVSRVINSEPNVRASTRERVEKAIDALQYRPNQFARNLASHRSRLIGLIYDDPSAYEVPSSGYVIRLQEGTLRACHAANYELLIHPCRYRDKDVVTELEALIRHIRPTGIILAAPLSNMPRIVRAIQASGTPVVRLSPGKEDGKQFCVATNDREISAEMTRHLASLGHRRIAFIKGNRQHKAVGNRYLGYLDGLRDSGLEVRDELVAQGDNSVGSGEAAADQLLGLSKPPTAIFAANDDMAAGVMRVAARQGIEIPARLSVAGCDDISLARQFYPSLTTIRQPIAAMAELATLALVDGSHKDSLYKGVAVVPAQLRIRESTGPAPSEARS
ncbi:LacI family DNA-binding transcriptional regulator [Wenzhouxiangella sp. XN24]|uniref:LacI family DNA-binding transcriptional regulator n=1 Tax=Wenzhouxiangella sp. XN24 TaxID=2713569 RepID=UPI00197FFE15|nr:LacI family DNA-binding transcriptional regulator [Wenzhouxiangella sp. XN24]